MFVLCRGRQEKLPPPYVLSILSKLTFVAMISLVEYRTFAASCG